MRLGSGPWPWIENRHAMNVPWVQLAQRTTDIAHIFLVVHFANSPSPTDHGNDTQCLAQDLGGNGFDL